MRQCAYEGSGAGKGGEVREQDEHRRGRAERGTAGEDVLFNVRVIHSPVYPC